MPFRLISSGGNVTDPAVVNMYASGTIRPGTVVDFTRTGGQGVVPATSTSSLTTIFGVALDYAQGTSGTQVRVIPFAPGQIWEAYGCASVSSTAHIGIRHALSASDRDVLNNLTNDTTTAAAIFRCIGITGLTTGSGSLIGYFRYGGECVPNISTATHIF
jgi:hypothetical protein